MKSLQLCFAKSSRFSSDVIFSQVLDLKGAVSLVSILLKIIYSDGPPARCLCSVGLMAEGSISWIVDVTAFL